MKNLAFHVGHHKTATTWLQRRYFARHPQINLVSNYRAPWDDRFLCYLIGSTDRSFSPMRCTELLSEQLQIREDNHVNLISAERLSGHPYSGGYDSYLIAERIHSCFPEARIMIAVRSQVAMLRAMYKALVRQGYLGTFSDLVSSKRWRGTAFSMDFLEYDLLVSKYVELFSEKNVLVLVYNDLRQDPRLYLNQISSFLTIGAFDYCDQGERVNVGLKDNRIRAMRHLNHFRQTELNPFPIFRLPHKLVRGLSRMLSPFLLLSGSGLMRDSEIEYVRSYYSESNQRLRGILRRDLSGFP
jgi:hypothetical protein